MAQARYILRLEDGELFPWYEPWLKIAGMVEYDPKKHGVREEVAKHMGLVVPEATMAPAKKAAKAKTAKVPEQLAGDAAPANRVATEPKAQAQPSDDLSGVFGPE